MFNITSFAKDSKFYTCVHAYAHERKYAAVRQLPLALHLIPFSSTDLTWWTTALCVLLNTFTTLTMLLTLQRKN